VRPVLVSRAVKRLASAAAHEDTIRSVKRHLGEATSSKRTELSKLTLDKDGKVVGPKVSPTKFSEIVGADDPRNAGLLYVLQIRLEEAGGDGKKAFGPNTPPVYKPRKDLTNGPLIRAVQVKTTQKGGVPVRGGVADQASMWRVDFFFKDGRHFPVPIYQSDRVARTLAPHHAVVGKKRERWPDISLPDFVFLFSLFQNDYLRIHISPTETVEGYFVGLDVSDGRIGIRPHDKTKDGDNTLRRVVHEAHRLEKLHVDILGNRYTAKPESRGDLA
jgi:CRISPR-associated endonuclease Csn1